MPPGTALGPALTRERFPAQPPNPAEASMAAHLPCQHLIWGPWLGLAGGRGISCRHRGLPRALVPLGREGRTDRQRLLQPVTEPFRGAQPAPSAGVAPQFPLSFVPSPQHQARLSSLQPVTVASQARLWAPLPAGQGRWDVGRCWIPSGQCPLHLLGLRISVPHGCVASIVTPPAPSPQVRVTAPPQLLPPAAHTENGTPGQPLPAPPSHTRAYCCEIWPLLTHPRAGDMAWTPAPIPALVPLAARAPGSQRSPIVYRGG